jgi:hypothetical protein
VSFWHPEISMSFDLLLMCKDDLISWKAALRNDDTQFWERDHKLAKISIILVKLANIFGKMCHNVKNNTPILLMKKAKILSIITTFGISPSPWDLVRLGQARLHQPVS